MARVSVLLLLALAACGAPAPTPHGPGHPAAPGGAPIATAPLRAHLCERAKALQTGHCSPFDQMGPSLISECTVADSLFISSTQACVDEASCDAVQACMVEVARTGGGPYIGPTTACTLAAGADNIVPAGVSPREALASYGRNDRAFADSPSTKVRPIEVCGMQAETGYLTRVTCADGSHPFADRAAADGSRTGNVGAGGRCGRTIDQYDVPCPERTYSVFIDAYRCPARAS